MTNTAKPNIQDQFLEYLCHHKTPTTVFLVNGVKLQGYLTWFDDASLLLRREAHSQLIYKHAISTVMPNEPVRLFESPAAAMLDDSEAAA